MADNLVLMEGSGALLATDDVDGVHVLRFKVQTGADGAASDVSTDNPLPIAVRGAGLSVFRAIGLSTSAQVAKAGPGRVFGWHLANTGAGGAFVKLYDAAEAPQVGAYAPTVTLYVPPGGAVSAEHPNGIAFANGVSVAATTGAAISDTGAPASGAVIVDLFHADVDVADPASAGGASGASGGVAAATANTIALRDSTGKLFAAGYDAGGERVTGVAAPVQSTDAANKAYVDARTSSAAEWIVPPVALDFSAGDATITVADGRFRTVEAGNLTADVVVTVSTAGAVANDVIRIARFDKGSWMMRVQNGGAGGGTLATLAGSGDLVVQFDGTNWIARELPRANGFAPLSARELGALGNGDLVSGHGQNDQPMLQAWIDALRKGGGVGELPPGIYRIEAPLVIGYDQADSDNQHTGLVIRGPLGGPSGPNPSAIILWDGDPALHPDQPMIKLQSGGCTFEGISFQVASGRTCASAIDFDRGPSLDHLTARAATFDPASDVVTLNAHGFSNGTMVVLTTTGTLPAGLSATTVYYATDVTTNTFKLTETFGGPVVNFTTAGTGTSSVAESVGSPTTRNSFKSCQFLGHYAGTPGHLTYGVRVGHGNTAPAGLEDLYFENCTWSNIDDTCFFVERSNGQSKNHLFLHCIMSGSPALVPSLYGIRLTSGSFQSVGLQISYMQGAAVQISGSCDTITMVGTQSEQCKRFLDTSGGGASSPSSQHVHLDGARLDTGAMATDGVYMKLTNGGPYELTNVAFQRSVGGVGGFVAGSDVITIAGHGFYDDLQVVVRNTSNGALPAPLVAGTVYYVLKIDDNTFKLSSTPVASPTVITMTSAGSGTNVVNPNFKIFAATSGVGATLITEGSTFPWSDPIAVGQGRCRWISRGDRALDGSVGTTYNMPSVDKPLASGQPHSHQLGAALLGALGNEVAYDLQYSVSKPTGGNDTGLRINRTPGTVTGTSLLVDVQNDGVSKFSVNSGGRVVAPEGRFGKLTGSGPFTLHADDAFRFTVGASNSPFGLVDMSTAFGYSFIVCEQPTGLIIRDNQSGALVELQALGANGKVRCNGKLETLLMVDGAVKLQAQTGFVQVNTQISSPIVSVAFSTTPTFNFASGNHHKLGALTDNVTSVTLSNARSGAEYSIWVQQDGTGGRTITWPSAVKFGELSGTPDARANAWTLWKFLADASGNLWCLSVNRGL